jgi:hypothetical protein
MAKYLQDVYGSHPDCELVQLNYDTAHPSLAAPSPNPASDVTYCDVGAN